MHLFQKQILPACQECCSCCLCKVCSSLEQKKGYERAITGSKIILTCPFFEYVLIFWEGRTLKKGRILALLHFFLQFGLSCKKREASQGFWYQEVGADMLFRNEPPPDLHNNRCSCCFPFPLNFQAVLPPKLGPPWKKIIFLESSLRGLSTICEFRLI